jgi:hypothetical protein
MSKIIPGKGLLRAQTNKAAILARVRILQATIVPISLTAKRGGMLQG